MHRLVQAPEVPGRIPFHTETTCSFGARSSEHFRRLMVHEVIAECRRRGTLPVSCNSGHKNEAGSSTCHKEARQGELTFFAYLGVHFAERLSIALNVNTRGRGRKKFSL